MKWLPETASSALLVESAAGGSRAFVSVAQLRTLEGLRETACLQPRPVGARGSGSNEVSTTRCRDWIDPVAVRLILLS